MKDVYLILKDGKRLLTWTWPDDHDTEEWAKGIEPFMAENGIIGVEVLEAPPWRFKRAFSPGEIEDIQEIIAEAA